MTLVREEGPPPQSLHHLLANQEMINKPGMYPSLCATDSHPYTSLKSSGFDTKWLIRIIFHNLQYKYHSSQILCLVGLFWTNEKWLWSQIHLIASGWMWSISGGPPSCNNLQQSVFCSLSITKGPHTFSNQSQKGGKVSQKQQTNK